MTRISHITSSASTFGGGISIALQALATAQSKAGLEVSVIGQHDGGTLLQGWPTGMLHEVMSRRVPAMRWSTGLVELLDSQKAELVHSHGLWSQPSISVPRWAARHRSPYVVSPHGMLDTWALGNSRWKKRFAGFLYERTNLRRAACLHALCQPEAESMRGYGLKNPIAVIPNGVDLPEIGDQVSGVRGQECIGSGSDLDSKRSQTGMAGAQRRQSGRKVLLFLGRLHPKKGLVNALRAWSWIRSQGSGVRGKEEWTFAIAGWDQGGHEAELKELCKELGLAYAETSASEFLNLSPDFCPLNPVTFLGSAFDETKDALLRRADAFILPSFSEGLPMSVLEAWAYQLPVLMTEHCNLPEGFAADAAIRIGTGLRAQGTGDSSQGTGVREKAMPIEEGLRTLFEMSDADRMTMGRQGRLLVEQQFTWQQVAAQMKEVYEWVLGDGPKPGCVVD